MLPCIPRATATQKVTATSRPRLADLVPPTQPMIPHTLIHLVNELERARLGFIGLYRVPGWAWISFDRSPACSSEGQVSQLLHRFYNDRSVPQVRAVDDAATLTGVVKRFLAQLHQPLIPTSSWHQFVDAADDRELLAAL